MNDPHPDTRDGDADDLFVDHCLQQELGGTRPPDLAAYVAAATPMARARAAAAVDAASTMAPRWRLAPLGLAAALAALAMLWWTIARQPTGGPASGQTGGQTCAATAQRLLDEFHAVMPHYPAMLRDDLVRRDRRELALPVLRDIQALDPSHPANRVYSGRVREFEFYAALLGDEAVLTNLRREAAGGDADAAAELAAVRVATAWGSDRAVAIAALAELLPACDAFAPLLVHCLNTADLLPEEAARIAPSLRSTDAQTSLLRSAAANAASPRRLCGERLQLAGPLFDGTDFDSASLHGRPVLLCFWAVWCQPSRVLLERIDAVRRRLPDFELVGVSCDHDAAVLRNYLADHPDRAWRVFFDRSRPGMHAFFDRCRAQTLPFALLLGPDGKVIEVNVECDLEGALRRHLDG